MSAMIKVPRIVRDDVAIRAETFNEEAHTIDVIFTTGARARQYHWSEGAYDEELVVKPGAVRLERLNAGAPLLNVHNRWDLASAIGSVVPGSAKITGGQGVATVKLSRREEVAGIIRDIRDGILRSISTSYRYHKVEKTEGEDGTASLWRVLDWEPLELSAVLVPADPGARFRSMGSRDVEADSFPCIVEAVRGTTVSRAASRGLMRMRELVTRAR